MQQGARWPSPSPQRPTRHLRPYTSKGACRRQFSATAGTLFHDSHGPLTDWLLAIYLMDSSKMRISAKEVERMLGMSYETAWNMHDRIGQAMEKPEQKAFLRKLIGVIGAPESEVGGHGGISRMRRFSQGCTGRT